MQNNNQHALNNILLALGNLDHNSPHRLGLEKVALDFNIALAKPTLIFMSGSIALVDKLFKVHPYTTPAPALSEWEAILKFGPDYVQSLFKHPINIKHGMAPLLVAHKQSADWKKALMERAKQKDFLFPLMDVAFKRTCYDTSLWEELFLTHLRSQPKECQTSLSNICKQHKISNLIPFVLAGFFPTKQEPPITFSGWFFHKMSSGHQQLKLKTLFPTIADYLLDKDAVFTYVEQQRLLCRTELNS